MRKPYNYFFLVIIVVVASCSYSLPQDYRIKPPAGWGVDDAVLMDNDVRIITPPLERAGGARPAVNIIVQPLTKPIDEFTEANIRYLEEHGNNAFKVQQGIVDINGITASWFSYTNDTGLKERECVNYIIPVDGFAYMITCGVSKGYMDAYADTFDAMVQTFYCVQ